MPWALLTSGVLAHQGGWDEIGLVAIPIVLLAALLWLANKRASAIQAGRGRDEGPTPD